MLSVQGVKTEQRQIKAKYWKISWSWAWNEERVKCGCCGQCPKLDWGMVERSPLGTSSCDESPLGLLSTGTHLLLGISYLFHKMHDKQWVKCNTFKDVYDSDYFHQRTFIRVFPVSLKSFALGGSIVPICGGGRERTGHSPWVACPHPLSAFLCLPSSMP